MFMEVHQESQALITQSYLQFNVRDMTFPRMCGKNWSFKVLLVYSLSVGLELAMRKLQCLVAQMEIWLFQTCTLLISRMKRQNWNKLKDQRDKPCPNYSIESQLKLYLSMEVTNNLTKEPELILEKANSYGKKRSIS